jgi:uncharacterized protein
MTNIDFIKKQVATAAINIQKTVQLLQEDCTIPFISISKRYWKSRWSTNWTHCQTSKENEVMPNAKTIVKSIEEQNG